MNTRAAICCAALLALFLGCETEKPKPAEPAGPSSAPTPAKAKRPGAKPTGKAAAPGGTAAPSGSAAAGTALDGLVIKEGWSSSKEGFIKICGEIKNESKSWVISPGVEVELYGADGKPLTVTSIVTETRKDLGQQPRDGQPAARMLLPPGEVAVFTYTRDVKKVAGTYASHKLFATGRVLDKPPPKVVIENEAKRIEDQETYFLTGKISNKGTVDCRSPGVVAGFYTADGKVRLTATETPDELFQKMLTPGKSIEFELKKHTFEAAAEIASVKLWADCNQGW